MAAKLGQLLKRALTKIEAAKGESGRDRRLVLEAQIGADPESGRLPIVTKLKVPKPRKGETWPEYKKRIGPAVSKKAESITESMSGDAAPIYSSGAISASLRPDQIEPLLGQKDTEMIELNPRLTITAMDDAIVDVEVERFHNNHGPFTGKGIRVAVLDSGVDKEHPFLELVDSVSTCGESDDIPGSHGTHCAGSVASRDSVFRGVAPNVDLINVKVLRSNGSGTHTDIAQGVDAALDRNADILSMSLGFNHLPSWSSGGHGWTCPQGKCVLCTAVDNAVALGLTAIVAAGNEHTRAVALRDFGFGDSFDTELGCPGHARRAITVAALTKRTFLPADFTSRGPTAYGLPKPDIAGPGVNVTSTVPVPRLPNGSLRPDVTRADLFDRKSGTSMATPVVAGAAALIMEFRRQEGMSTAPTAIRNDLLNHALAPMSLPGTVVGQGRLDLGRYRALLS